DTRAALTVRHAQHRLRRGRRRGNHRQREFERRALPFPFTLRCQLSAVQLDQAPRNRKPEPQTSVRARTARIRLTESLEYMREKCGIDSDPGVAYRDSD